MVLIDIQATASGESLTNTLLQTLTVEFVDISDQLTEAFSIGHSEPINVHFEASGYETSDFILSSGIVFVTILFAPVFVLILVVLRRACRCQRKVADHLGSRVKGIFFNGIIGFIEADLLALMTSSNINIYQVSRGAAPKSTSYYFAWAIQVLIVASVISLLAFMIRNVKKLTKKELSERIGVTYQKFNVGKSPKSTILVYFFSQTRSICLSYVMTFGIGSLISQIFFINFSSIAMLAMIGHLEPYLTRATHWLELMNEFFIRLILLCLLVCQTNFVAEVSARQKMGWAFIGVIVFVVLLNFSLVIATAARTIKLHCKKRYLRCKRRAQTRKLLSAISVKAGGSVAANAVASST